MSRILQRLFAGLAVAVVVTTVWSCNRMTTETPRAEGGAIVSVNETLSDGWITTKIQARYFLDRDVKARNIDVTTANGTVTLSGHVDSERARQRAVEIARNTDGVRRIEDRLQITRTGTIGTGGRDEPKGGREPERSVTGVVADAAITTMIQSKYFLDPLVKARDITVSTANGVVTVTGEVKTPQAHDQALALARETDGVKSVVDHLRVTGT